MEKATGNEQDVQVIDPQLLPEIIEESLPEQVLSLGKMHQSWTRFFKANPMQ